MNGLLYNCLFLMIRIALLASYAVGCRNSSNLIFEYRPVCESRNLILFALIEVLVAVVALSAYEMVGICFYKTVWEFAKILCESAYVLLRLNVLKSSSTQRRTRH